MYYKLMNTNLYHISKSKIIMYTNSTTDQETQKFKNEIYTRPLGISNDKTSSYFSQYYAAETQKRIAEIRAVQNSITPPDGMTNAEFVAMVKKIKEDREQAQIDLSRDTITEDHDAELIHVGDTNQYSSDIS